MLKDVANSHTPMKGALSWI